ncbi:Competence protein CoiA-like family protein OS=Streptomyces microflavus OX=1919 GN=Smic_83180 PE=4 SV=1 [Streptomyces microflavus]
MVIEHVRTLPGADRILARQRAVRAQFGPGAAHVWFLAKDPMQFARCGKLSVAPRGRDRTVHATIAPTAEQLAVITAGGGVYWLDGKQVLIPYGVHDFVHAPEKGEAWDFPDWRRKVWPNDWRISHPLPEPDATRWGLVPLALHQMTGTKATFSLREAREVMQALEDRPTRPLAQAPRRCPRTPRLPPGSPGSRADVRSFTGGPCVAPHAPELAQPRREEASPPPQPQTQAEAGIGAPGAGTQSPTAQSRHLPLPDRDGRPTGPVHSAAPPSPAPQPAAASLQGAGRDSAAQGQKGLRGALRQLLRKKHE